MSNQVYSNNNKKYISRQVNEYFMKSDNPPITADNVRDLTWEPLIYNRGEYSQLSNNDSTIEIKEEGLYHIAFHAVFNESSDPQVDRDIGFWINISSNTLFSKHGLAKFRNVAKGTDLGATHYAHFCSCTLYLKEGDEISGVVQNILSGVPDVVMRPSSQDQSEYTNIIITKLD